VSPFAVVDAVLGPLALAVVLYFFFVNSVYLVLMGSAALEIRRYLIEVRSEDRQALLSSPFVPSISVLVPAYNEELSIVETVAALRTLAYPNLEVVVVDDGSTDRTVEVLRDSFELVPVHLAHPRGIETEPLTAMFRSATNYNLVVAAKGNGGKADALNAAANIASGELVCALDADTVVEEDAMLKLVRPFLRSRDVVAAGATIRIVNDCVVERGRITDVRAPRNALAGLQAVEYLRAFLFGRLGWNRLGGNLVISGAFGLFRRDALLAIGGYDHGVGEDIELIVRLRRHGYETNQQALVEFVPDPVAWTEAPHSLQVLSRQRDRWHRGLADTVWRHRGVLGRRYGRLGMVSMPIFVLVELLAPVIEAIGLVVLPVGFILGRVDATFALLYLALAYGLAMMLSVLALLFEELSFRRYGTVKDRSILLLWAVLENVGYRQLTVWWRLKGLFHFLRGNTEWGVMERSGFRANR